MTAPALSTGVDALVDRQAIADLLLRYATALDTRDWELLERCFAQDATARYGAHDVAGAEGIVAHCRTALEALDQIQHISTNHSIRVDGDRAEATSYLHAIHAVGEPEPASYLVHSIYEDQLVRGGQGWQITRRERLEPKSAKGSREVLHGPSGARVR